MIGKILAATAGAKAAKDSSVGGAGGALLGVAAMTLMRRLSVPALIALTAGGYALKKWSDRQGAPEPAPEPVAPKRKPRKAAPKPA